MNEFVHVITGAAPEQDGVGTLMLSRPPTNALTRQMYREIIAAAHELGERADISVVILFGGHEIFCAGDDVPELRTLNAAEAAAADVALHRLWQLDPDIAYLSGDELPTGVRGFEVLEQLPFQERRLRTALAARSVGALEILVRGLDVDPDALRARMKLRGTEHLTVVLARLGSGAASRATAFICRPSR
nr:enoyl-CoA hydratase-related protein [Mycolicibacterium houstonense]